MIITWSEGMGYRGAEAFFLLWMPVKPAAELSSPSLPRKTWGLFCSMWKISSAQSSGDGHTPRFPKNDCIPWQENIFLLKITLKREVSHILKLYLDILASKKCWAPKHPLPVTVQPLTITKSSLCCSSSACKIELSASPCKGTESLCWKTLTLWKSQWLLITFHFLLVTILKKGHNAELLPSLRGQN